MQEKTKADRTIGYIDLRVFAHATENQNKVEIAAKNLFPQELADSIVFEKTILSGHHSNQIIMLTAKLTQRELLFLALEKIGASLSSLDKQQLQDNIELHLEKGNLFLRFDKQAALKGQLMFTQHDPIHLKVHFRNRTNQEVILIAKQYGLLP